MRYKIGGHTISVETNDKEMLHDMLPAYRPFVCDEDGGDTLFDLQVNAQLKRLPKDECRLIKDIASGVLNMCVYRADDGRYQFVINTLEGEPCGLLITADGHTKCKLRLRGDDDMRHYALNNALMIVYALSAAPHGTLLIHASVVRHNGRAYAFTAASGTGKSTHVANWMRYIEGCDIMNDDNPVIGFDDEGRALLYGSPWSGKTPCYRNIVAPLGALVLITRDDHNWVRRQKPDEAFGSLLNACSSFKNDTPSYVAVCGVVSRFVESVGMYTLGCLPDADAAYTCCRGLEEGVTC